MTYSLSARRSTWFFTPDASVADHLTSLNATHESNRKPPFVEAHDRLGNVISLVPSAVNENQEGKEQGSPSQENDIITLEASGFPIFAPQRAIIDIVAQVTDGNQLGPPTISPRTSTACSAFFTVTNKVAAELKGNTLDTPLGSIKLRITEPDEELPTPLPIDKELDAAFYDDVCPQEDPPPSWKGGLSLDRPDDGPDDVKKDDMQRTFRTG